MPQASHFPPPKFTLDRTIIAHARHNLSTFKVPTVVRLVAENDLPMLPTGNVDRQGLARVLTAG